MNGEEPLDEQYFKWLYSNIGVLSNRNKSKSHWKMARQLYKSEFLFYVPNDDNRADDGLQLRDEFLDQSPGVIFDSQWYELECSILEMMIALSRRASFEASGLDDHGNTPGDWFWKMANNLGLGQYTDIVCNEGALEEIRRIIDTINNRSYKPNGRGGMFPLRQPKDDQREVELWYQLSAYLLENHRLGF